MRRAQDRARSARFRRNGARSATTKSRAPGALKLASEASCARSARWECARVAGRFFCKVLYKIEINVWSIYAWKQILNRFFTILESFQIFENINFIIVLKIFTILTFPNNRISRFFNHKIWKFQNIE